MNINMRLAIFSLSDYGNCRTYAERESILWDALRRLFDSDASAAAWAVGSPGCDDIESTVGIALDALKNNNLYRAQIYTAKAFKSLAENAP